MTSRAVARTLIGGGGGVYSYIHVLPDQFLFKLINLNLISKETSRAEHEYMNKHPPYQRSSYGRDDKLQQA